MLANRIARNHRDLNPRLPHQLRDAQRRPHQPPVSGLPRTPLVTYYLSLSRKGEPKYHSVKVPFDNGRVKA